MDASGPATGHETALGVQVDQDSRCRITLTRHLTDKTIVAEWLTVTEALALRAELQERCRLTYPDRTSWTRPIYGIERHLPELRKGAEASIGDLVIHELVEPMGNFRLSDVDVFRQFLRIASVTDIQHGRVTAFRDDLGEHYRSPHRPITVSSNEIDADAAMLTLGQRYRDRDHWGVEFTNTTAVQHFLMRFIRPQPPVYPSLEICP